MKSLIAMRNDYAWKIRDIELRLPNARTFERDSMATRQKCYEITLQQIERCIIEQDRMVANAAKKLVRKIISQIEL